MALKKSQLYSSLWQSCDELHGGMDASQYKDYVLTLLFMKYVSDKYAGKPDALAGAGRHRSRRTEFFTPTVPGFHEIRVGRDVHVVAVNPPSNEGNLTP